MCLPWVAGVRGGNLPTPARETIFSDKVITPTELARRVRDITKGALDRPVTIHRAEGDLALMSRDRVAELAKLASATEELAELGRNLVWLLRGRGEPTPAWAWLRAFDPDDVADFLDEFTAAVEAAIHGSAGWDDAQAVLHEWEESARALENGSLLANFAAYRGVATEAEAARLTTDELRRRLAAAVGNQGQAS
jgi:hypothetical protein